MPHSFADLINHIRGVHGFDYSRIDDFAFIGTNACCKYGFNRELLAHGVRADISLEEDRVDAPIGVGYFLWLPTPDRTPPSPGQLNAGVSFLQTLHAAGEKVFIHCANGHGRAPTLYAAYLIAEGMGTDEAISYIMKMRPSIHVELSQREALRKFEAS